MAGDRSVLNSAVDSGVALWKTLHPMRAVACLNPNRAFNASQKPQETKGMPTVIKRRRRIVSFRVSEEEYLNLCQATDSAGAHSISDFARHVTCHHSLVLVGGGNGNGNNGTNGHGIHASTAELAPAPAMAMEITRLRERMDDVDQKMTALARRVSRI